MVGMDIPADFRYLWHMSIESMKALIAEDDPASQVILEKMLSPFGEVDVTANGQDAVESFIRALNHRKPYHLVCLDIMMPGLDGQSVLRRIRGVENAKMISPDKRAKIIMTTAVRDRENVIAAIHEQCDGYFVKPLKTNLVYDRLRELGFEIKPRDGERDSSRQ